MMSNATPTTPVKPTVEYKSQALSAISNRTAHRACSLCFFLLRSTVPCIRSIRARLATHLVCDFPFLKPFKMPPLLIVTFHTKHNRPKQDEQPNDKPVEHPIDCPLDLLVLSRQRTGHPIHHESHGQDGKVQCRVIMMNVSDACHSHKR